MNETRTLAQFVSNSDFGRLPGAVIEHAKRLVLDHFAVALFASRTEWGRIAVKYARQFSCVAEATVYGEAWKTSAQHAALANGLCAHGYEIDDSYQGGFCHPGAPVIPAALAVAERERRSGRDFLLGVVMGYEAMGRVSAALGREGNKQHHATGQVGTFGAAAAAARIMGLDETAVTNAFGIAGCMSSGVMEFADEPKGTMVKRLYGGWPSQSGVVAAWFAREGYTGPATIIEGRKGFLRGITPHYSVEGMLDGLGEDYHILRTVFKPYASCRAFHPMIEAIGELRSLHGVAAGEIEKLRVGARASILDYQMVYEPRSVMAAQYSMPFTAALALHRDLEDPTSVDEAAVDDPVLIATARCVEGYLDEEIDRFERYAARVQALLRSGRTISVTRWDHKGTPARPYTDDELVTRFHKITSSVIPGASATRIIDAVGALDGAGEGSLQRLTDALSGTGGK
jgi:2-methylcitrate dehydratase PrpD